MPNPAGLFSRSHVLAAFALFAATIYAPFAIAVFLTGSSASHERVEYVLVKVLLCMIVGTALSAIRTSTPLAVAPAVGLTAFFISGLSLIKPNEIYECSIAAGFITICLCFPLRGRAIRHHIIEAVPSEVKQGVRGGVGALLAEKSVEDILRYDHHDHFRVLMVALGAAVLFWADVLAARAGTPQPAPGTPSSPQQPWASTVFRVPVVAIPMVIFALCVIYLGGGVEATQAFDIHKFFNSMPDELRCWKPPAVDEFMNLLIFSGIIVFVFLTDVPGTPYELLAKLRLDGRCEDGLETEHGERAVRNSFLVDGIMSIFNAFLQVPPSIYYAENFVLKSEKDEQHMLSGRAAFTYCLMLCSVVALIVVLPLPVRGLSEWAGIAVAPVLLVVGIRIVAASMRSEHEESEEALQRSVATQNGIGILFYAPTALTIILSPIIGLQMSLPIGILSYCAMALLEDSDKQRATAMVPDLPDGKKDEAQIREAALLARVVTCVLLGVSATVLLGGVLVSIPQKPYAAREPDAARATYKTHCAL